MVRDEDVGWLFGGRQRGDSQCPHGRRDCLRQIVAKSQRPYCLRTSRARRHNGGTLTQCVSKCPSPAIGWVSLANFRHSYAKSEPPCPRYASCRGSAVAWVSRSVRRVFRSLNRQHLHTVTDPWLQDLRAPYSENASSTKALHHSRTPIHVHPQWNRK